MIAPNQLRGLVAEVLPTVTELRRAIHRHPELSFAEFATTDRVAEVLRHGGLNPQVRESGTGLIAEIGDGPKLVGFRSDLDALPILEPADNPHASQIPGVMHACGHDAHTAIGVGIALALARIPLPGRIRFIFQPGEESFPGGAVEMVREGAVADMSSIIAFHVDPSLEVGSIGLRTGAITGSADRFTVRLEGPGGHTARPHRTVDLVYAAGRVITDLPFLVGRAIDPRRPLAVVFGGLLPWGLGFLWGDPVGALLVAGFTRLMIQYHATFAVNSVAHYIGKRPYSDKSSARDSFITAIITLGEGYHNFHHSFQLDYRNGVRWWQLDPTKWFVWTMSKVGVTSDLRRVSNERIEAALLKQREATKAA